MIFLVISAALVPSGSLPRPLSAPGRIGGALEDGRLTFGLHGGPALTAGISLYSFLGYCLLVTAAILAVRVLVQVFRPRSE